MPVSDHNIHYAAHLWMTRFGDGATAKAREMVEAMQRKGDQEKADVWQRVITAIATLGTPATGAPR